MPNDKPTYEELEQKVKELEEEAVILEQGNELLRLSEERYRSLFENTGAATFVAEEDMTISQVNVKGVELSGFSKDDLLGKMKTIDFIAPEDLEKVIRYHWERRKDGGDAENEYEFNLIDKNGNIKNVFVQGAIIPGTKQSIASIIDITERKQAEAKLLETERRLVNVFETIDMISVMLDRDGNILFCNNFLLSLTGFKSEEVLNKNWFETFLPDDVRNNVRSHVFNRMLESGDFPKCNENEIVTREGKRRLIKWNNTVFFDFNGAVETITSIGEDITEQKKSEEALRKSEEKFKQLAEMLPETIFEADLTGRITFVNQNAYNVFKYTKDDFDQGLNTIDMVAPSDRTKAINNIGKVLQGEKNKPEEYNAIKKDGTIFPVLIQSVAINSGRETIGLRGIIVDMSEQKMIQAQLRQAQKMESIGTLTGGIAHDFNNILTIILGNTELVLDDTPEWYPTWEYLTKTKSASLRAKDLIKQLLTFARKSEEKQSPIKISYVAKESLKLLRSSIPTNIELNQDIPDECYTIKADPTQIHQILINLITNSAHAIEDSGIITVELEDTRITQKQTALINDLEPGNYVRITVKDSGFGIEPEDFERIFDPYFTTKEIGKGTGMGLAVVHGIVKSHDGSILLESGLNHGTAFSIFFPATQADVEKEIIRETKISVGTESILIVDDEEDIVMWGQMILEKLGYTVESSTHPHEALELIKSVPNQFNLIITDMAMPKMTGDNLATEIQKINPNLPVILCTGYSDRIDEDMAKAIGIKAFLMKPMSRKLLADTVRKVLDER